MARPLPEGLRLPRHSTRYRRALNSQLWRDLRVRLIAERGGVCEVCGFPEVRGRPHSVLQLHHLTYERLGRELDEDVQVICWRCHRIAFRAANPHLIG
jgi:5-methylcytosine-specific restriction endonuclease McrA